MKTINKIVKINKIKIAIIIRVEIAPVLPNSNVVTKALGISATIPAKIIKKTFNRLKILGNGDLKTKLNIETNFISKSAKIKLDKLGCSVSIKTIS